MPYHHDINALLMLLFWCRLLGARRWTAPHRSTECKGNKQLTSVEYEFSIQVHLAMALEIKAAITPKVTGPPHQR